MSVLLDERMVLVKAKKLLERMLKEPILLTPDIEAVEDMLNALVWNRHGGAPQVDLRRRFGR